MAFGYPVALELSGRKAVVIGDLAVALGKAQPLMDAEAAVTVVARGPSPDIEALRVDARAEVLERRYREGDLDGAYICVASSDDPAEMDALCEEGHRNRVLMNVIDRTDRCDWAAPAIVRRGDLAITVSTGGRSPALARRLKEEIAGRYGAEWAEVLDVLEAVRLETMPHLPDVAERSRRWSEALDLGELTRLVSAGRGAEAAVVLRDRLLAAREIA